MPLDWILDADTGCTGTRASQYTSLNLPAFGSAGVLTRGAPRHGTGSCWDTIGCRKAAPLALSPDGLCVRRVEVFVLECVVLRALVAAGSQPRHVVVGARALACRPLVAA